MLLRLLQVLAVLELQLLLLVQVGELARLRRVDQLLVLVRVQGRKVLRHPDRLLLLLHAHEVVHELLLLLVLVGDRGRCGRLVLIAGRLGELLRAALEAGPIRPDARRRELGRHGDGRDEGARVHQGCLQLALQVLLARLVRLLLLLRARLRLVRVLLLLLLVLVVLLELELVLVLVLERVRLEAVLVLLVGAHRARGRVVVVVSVGRVPGGVMQHVSSSAVCLCCCCCCWSTCAYLATSDLAHQSLWLRVCCRHFSVIALFLWLNRDAVIIHLSAG